MSPVWSIDVLFFVIDDECVFDDSSQLLSIFYNQFHYYQLIRKSYRNRFQRKQFNESANKNGENIGKKREIKNENNC